MPGVTHGERLDQTWPALVDHEPTCPNFPERGSPHGAAAAKLVPRSSGVNAAKKLFYVPSLAALRRSRSISLKA